MKKIFVVICVAAAIGGCSKEAEPVAQVQLAPADAAYDAKMEQITQAALENEAARQHDEEHPPVYPSVGTKQTKDFLARIDAALAANGNVNLKFSPDVAAHSRVFNALNKEAESVYGQMAMDNPYQYCLSSAVYARQIWTNVYSISTLPEEYKRKTHETIINSYADAKKGCMDSVNDQA